MDISTMQSCPQPYILANGKLHVPATYPRGKSSILWLLAEPVWTLWTREKPLSLPVMESRLSTLGLSLQMSWILLGFYHDTYVFGKVWGNMFLKHWFSQPDHRTWQLYATLAERNVIPTSPSLLLHSNITQIYRSRGQPDFFFFSIFNTIRAMTAIPT
jgi:hypothetical protein